MDVGDDALGACNQCTPGREAPGVTHTRYPLSSRCPTAELTATVFEDGSVELRRTTRTQSAEIWRYPLNNVKTRPLLLGVALAWKPDGKVLGIALSDGSIRYHDVNSGNVIETVRLCPPDHSGNITFLRWVQLIHCGRKPKRRLARRSKLHCAQDSLPALAKIPNAPCDGMLHARVEHGTAVPRLLIDRYGDSMDVVIAMDSRGYAYICLFGVFCIPVSVELPFCPPQCQIVDAEVAHDFSNIEVTVAIHVVEVAPSPSNDEPSRIRIVLDTSTISRSVGEIRQLSILSAQINFLLGYIADALLSLEREFNSLLQLMSRNLNRFQELLDDNGAETTPAAEFAMLIGRGIPSPSLDQYIQRELTDRTLRKWIELAGLSFENLVWLANEQLQPACEQLIAHLNELVGICRWKALLCALGLEEKQLHSCIRLAGSLMARLEELVLKVHVEADSFAAFGAWLKDVKSTPEEATDDVDTTKVISFLEHTLSADRLGSFFASSKPEQSVVMFLPEVEFEKSGPEVRLPDSQRTLPSSPRVIKAAKGARSRVLRTPSALSAERQSQIFAAGDSPAPRHGSLERPQAKLSGETAVTTMAAISTFPTPHPVTTALAAYEVRSTLPTDPVASTLPAYPIPFVTPLPPDDALEMRKRGYARWSEVDVNYPTLKFHAESLADSCRCVLKAASAAIGSQIRTHIPSSD